MPVRSYDYDDDDRLMYEFFRSYETFKLPAIEVTTSIVKSNRPLNFLSHNQIKKLPISQIDLYVRKNNIYSPNIQKWTAGAIRDCISLWDGVLWYTRWLCAGGSQTEKYLKIGKFDIDIASFRDATYNGKWKCLFEDFKQGKIIEELAHYIESELDISALFLSLEEFRSQGFVDIFYDIEIRRNEGVFESLNITKRQSDNLFYLFYYLVIDQIEKILIFGICETDKYPFRKEWEQLFKRFKNNEKIEQLTEFI